MQIHAIVPWGAPAAMHFAGLCTLPRIRSSSRPHLCRCVLGGRVSATTTDLFLHARPCEKSNLPGGLDQMRGEPLQIWGGLGLYLSCFEQHRAGFHP